MLIRKLFRFENAHIVRNCSSDRCSRSLHGHSYVVEFLLERMRWIMGRWFMTSG